MSDQHSAAVARWAAMVAPPSAGPVAVSWPDVEARLGTRLPSDYRWLVDVYGAGVVGDVYWVLHPLGPTGIDLERTWRWERSPEASRHFRLPPPHPIGPLDGGLLPCALDEDAGVLYWHAATADPDRWTVVLRDEDADTWTALPLTLVEFLVELFAGRLPQLGFDTAGPTTFRPAS